MLKKNKNLLILTSLLTLLPVLVGLLLWDRFPEQMAVHWGINGEADGWGSVPFAVFTPPVVLLAAHWLCILVTAKDPRNQDKNRKPFTLVLWIIPITSNLCCYILYALALGAEFSVSTIMLAAMGLLFAAIGNYLPKCKMNSTIGIKVPWTYSSEENWNATHRFGGRVWVIGGLVIAVSAFLPGGFGIVVMISAIFALTIIPIVYSWRYYKMQKARGDALIPFPKMTKRSWIAVILLLIFLGAVLFAGSLEFDYSDDYFTVKASHYGGLTVFYDVIESVEYREGDVDGFRVGGYGSFRLLLGYFQSEEFGTYTRYTYYKPDACVVLTLKDNTVVLSGATAAETQEIYQELLSRTN